MALQLVKDHNFRSPNPKITHAALALIKSGVVGATAIAADVLLATVITAFLGLVALLSIFNKALNLA